MADSLKVTSAWKRKVSSALKRQGFATQKALADTLGITPRKVSNFLAGKPIDREAFVEICEALALPWEEVSQGKAAVSRRTPSSTLPTRSGPIRKEPLPVVQTAAEEEEDADSLTGLAPRAIPKLTSHLFRSAAPTVPGERADSLTSPDAIASPSSSLQDSQEGATKAEATSPPVPVVPPAPAIPVAEIAPECVPTAVPSVSPPPVVSPPIPPAATPVNPPTSSRPTPEPTAPKVIPIPTAVDAMPEVPAVPPNAVVAPLPPLVTLARTGDREPIAPERPLLEDTESLLELFRNACTVQAWDAAAEALAQIDWYCVRQVRGAEFVLDLHRQLLPATWRTGDRRLTRFDRHWETLDRMGQAHLALEQFDDALACYEAAREAARRESNSRLEAESLRAIGLVYQTAGHFQTALTFYQTYFERATQQQDDRACAMALCNLGNTYYELRQYRTAIRYYQQYLAKAIDFATEPYVLGNLGNAFYNLGDYQTAIAYQERHLDIVRTLDNLEKEAMASINLGFSYYAMGLDRTALEHHQTALGLAQRLGNRRLEMAAFKGMGMSYHSLAIYDRAIANYRQWLAAARLLGDRDEEIRAMYALRKVHGYLVKVRQQQA